MALAYHFLVFSLLFFLSQENFREMEEDFLEEKSKV